MTRQQDFKHPQFNYGDGEAGSTQSADRQTSAKYPQFGKTETFKCLSKIHEISSFCSNHCFHQAVISF